MMINIRKGEEKRIMDVPPQTFFITEGDEWCLYYTTVLDGRNVVMRLLQSIGPRDSNNYSMAIVNLPADFKAIPVVVNDIQVSVSL